MKLGFLIKGFSFPELAATLAVAAVLVALTAPAMKSIFADRRITALTQQLYGSIQLARSEAVKRGAFASLCRTTTGIECADEGSDWVSGWLVFTDANSNGSLDEDDQLVRVYGAQSENVQVSWNRGHYLRFDSRGQARDAGSFTVCEVLSDKTYGRSISVSLTGRARVIELDEC